MALSARFNLFGFGGKVGFVCWAGDVEGFGARWDYMNLTLTLPARQDLNTSRHSGWHATPPSWSQTLLRFYLLIICWTCF
jgi:hypothetical protein